MQPWDLIESQDSVVDLSPGEAAALREAGRRLASSATWWGDDQGPTDRTVIAIQPLSGTRWQVRVVDAIGVIVSGNTQLIVHPKIP
jgi:hypothetical protein